MTQSISFTDYNYCNGSECTTTISNQKNVYFTDYYSQYQFIESSKPRVLYKRQHQELRLYYIRILAIWKITVVFKNFLTILKKASVDGDEGELTRTDLSGYPENNDEVHDTISNRQIGLKPISNTLKTSYERVYHIIHSIWRECTIAIGLNKCCFIICTICTNEDPLNSEDNPRSTRSSQYVGKIIREESFNIKFSPEVSIEG